MCNCFNLPWLLSLIALNRSIGPTKNIHIIIRYFILISLICSWQNLFTIDF